MNETGLPYPGLRAFTRDESYLFFGRDGCIDAMIDRLAATRFLAVLGASGSGKSSLVRTGLLDALELGFYAKAGARWSVVEMHPGGAPLRNLAAGIAAVSVERPQAVDVEVFRALVKRGPRSIVEWCVSGGLKAGHNLLILVDQFEELFRYGDYAAREEAEAFVALLLESARARDVPIHVALTMRSEYLGACALVQGLAEQINAGFYLTPRMNREECRLAIEGPASVSGFAIQPALVNQLLNDMASFAPWEEQGGAQQSQVLSRRADQLPLMQHLLNRLWQRARARTTGPLTLTIDDYREVGGLAGALDAHGAEVVASLVPKEQGDIERVFRALVSGPDPTNAVRRPCRFSELAAEVKGGSAEARRIVDAFRAAGCNFLQPDDTVALDDETVIDISHESLIRQWDVLSGWLRNEARADANWRRLLVGAERRRAKEGDLLAGLELDSLAAWWAAEQPTPSWAARHGGRHEEARAFLEASRDAVAAERQKAQARAAQERALLIGGVTVLTMLLVASVWFGHNAHGAKAKLIQTNENLKRAQTAQNEALQRARENEQKATGALDEANRARDKASAAEKRAKDEAREYANLLGDLQQIVHSEKYESLLGFEPMQKELDDHMQPVLQKIDARYADVVAPAAVVQTRRFRAGTLAALGNAGRASDLRDEAFKKGMAELKRFKSRDARYDELAAEVILTGVRAGWSLFDAGDDAAGERFLFQMGVLARQYDYATAPPKLFLPLARYEKLRARRADDLGESSLASEHQKRAKFLCERKGAPEKDRGSLSHLRLFILRESDHPGPQGNASQEEACRLAEENYRATPLDAQSIADVVNCRENQAALANKKGDKDQADKLTNDAGEILRDALAQDPNSTDLLLVKSELVLTRAEIAEARQQYSQAAELKMVAADTFVLANQGRQVDQASTGQARNAYDRIVKADLSRLPEYATSGSRLRFFAKLREAVQKNRERIPAAPSYAFVDGDAAMKIAEILEADKHFEEAEKVLRLATKAFDKGRIIERVTGFSEDTCRVCTAWSSLVRVRVALNHVDDADQSYKELVRRCRPPLEKYPWDFYLRSHFLDASVSLGKALYEKKRFSEAFPLLKESSDWGRRESSESLAEMYESGWGVVADAKRAADLKALAKRQLLKKVKVSVSFDEVKFPVDFYVQEFAAGVGFDGIDDQVRWVKEAWGGDVPEEVVASFRNVNEIARENGVSFPELAVYVTGQAKDSKGEAKGEKEHSTDKKVPSK